MNETGTLLIDNFQLCHNELPAESNDAEELYETPLGLSAITWNIIKLREGEEPRTRFFNYQCMHCAEAACVTACPSGALYKDENSTLLGPLGVFVST